MQQACARDVVPAGLQMSSSKCLIIMLFIWVGSQVGPLIKVVHWIYRLRVLHPPATPCSSWHVWLGISLALRVPSHIYLEHICVLDNLRCALTCKVTQCCRSTRWAAQWVGLAESSCFYYSSVQVQSAERSYPGDCRYEHGGRHAAAGKPADKQPWCTNVWG